MSGENGERLAVQGPRGPQGERGEQGMTAGARRAVISLFAFTLVLAGLNLFWTAHEVNASRSAIQAEHAREQAEQRQAGAVLGGKLCLTFGKLAALKPPPGPAAENPSRAFEQELHATLDELGADLGCK